MATQGTRIGRAAALVTLSIACAACAASRPTVLPGAIAPPAGEPLRVQVAGRIESVPLEDYVAGSALSEITPVGEPQHVVARVYDVQTILARTYAVSHRGRHRAQGFDLCDTTHCQVYEPARLRSSQFAAAARAAAGRTRGRLLRVGQTPIDAVFHADCGGHTTTPVAAWGGSERPYLPARRDELGPTTHRQWSFEATFDEWRDVLNQDPRTAVGERLTDLRVVRTGPGDRVVAISVDGTTPRQLSGDALRSAVSAARGPRAVMSTRFTVTRTSRGLRLDGTGFGHGVGLCQVGALARARRGDSLRSILEHYYPGSTLTP